MFPYCLLLKLLNRRFYQWIDYDVQLIYVYRYRLKQKGHKEAYNTCTWCRIAVYCCTQSWCDMTWCSAIVWTIWCYTVRYYTILFDMCWLYMTYSIHLSLLHVMCAVQTYFPQPTTAWESYPILMPVCLRSCNLLESLKGSDWSDWKHKAILRSIECAKP